MLLVGGPFCKVCDSIYCLSILQSWSKKKVSNFKSILQVIWSNLFCSEWGRGGLVGSAPFPLNFLAPLTCRAPKVFTQTKTKYFVPLAKYWIFGPNFRISPIGQIFNTIRVSVQKSPLLSYFCTNWPSIFVKEIYVYVKGHFKANFVTQSKKSESKNFSMA